MKKEQDYIKDISEIRSMMERSSRFLPLSGWAGILAGLYALAAAFIASNIMGFYPTGLYYHGPAKLENLALLAGFILVLALVTVTLLSYNKVKKDGEKLWTPATRRLIINGMLPLICGGIFALILSYHHLVGMILPATLLFYGLALYNASKFTYDETRILGVSEIILGLISAVFIDYSLICWALGFGVANIIYGIYMHYQYEK